jgi:hypothetical protein
MVVRLLDRRVIAAVVGCALAAQTTAVFAAQEAASSRVSDEADVKPVTDRCGTRYQRLQTQAFVFPTAAQPGQPVTVVLSTRNLGSAPVYPIFDLDPCEMTIHDSAGKPVALTALGRMTWVELNGRIENDMPRDVCIKPGFAVAEKLCAEKYYDLSRPGQYTIVAGRPSSFEVTRRQIPQEANAKDERHNVTTGSLDDETSFERKWQTASAVAGQVHNDLQLTSIIAPYERRGTNLVVSLTNVCLSGTIAHNDGQSYSASYSPEDGVDLTVGRRAADYQILLRDASRNPVPLSAKGQLWLRESELKWDRPLRPGEAVGFAFPLDELFAVKPGRQYEALVVLRSPRRDGTPWVAAPAKVNVPSVEVPGVTRPRYGSNEFWIRLATSDSARRAKLTLESTIRRHDDYVFLKMELVNRSGTPIPAHFHGGDETFLIRDSRGDPVLPNQAAKDDPAGWGFTRGKGWGVLQPRAEEAGDDSGATCGYGLSEEYPLRAGNDYTMLAAVSLREADALVVARPVAFRAPFPYRHESETPETRPLNPGPSPTVPVDAGRRWQENERFAGKTFEGLALQAHATASLQLDIELHNSSKEPILVKKWKGDSDYELLVRDASGRSASMTGKGKKFFGGAALLEFRDLKAGEAISASLPLTELFDMQTPGEYTVLASLPVIGDVDAVLTAAPIKVRVETKPGAPKN